MKLAADENVEAAIVRWLRDDGHDATWACEDAAGGADARLLQTATAEGRILLTNDLDFGELTFRQRLISAGIILIRLRAALQADRLRLFQLHWPMIASHAPGHFVVVRNDRVRCRRIMAD